MMMIENIKLEKYTLLDYTLFYSLVSDNEVMKYITEKGLTEIEAIEKFNNILHINDKEHSLGYFKVLNQKDEFLGDCKLEWNSQDSSLLEIGYILKKEFRRMGIGTAICNKLLTASQTLYANVDIIGIIDPSNIASKKLLEKFGFKSYFVGIEDNLPTEKLILKREITK